MLLRSLHHENYQWRRNYGDRTVQDLYPLYPQVKDAAYVKILSKRL